MQDASTDDLIFGIPELVAHLSRLMTLEPGDIVSTGHAVGRRLDPRPARLAQARRRDRDQLADAGAAGDADRRSQRRAPPRCAANIAASTERQEPHDVEVEPVRRARAGRRSVTAAASAATWARASCAGARRRPRPPAPPRRPRSTRPAGSRSDGRQAPDAERRAARRLVAERVVVELPRRPPWGRNGTTQGRRDGDERRRRRRSPSATGARRSRSRTAARAAAGPNLAAAASATSAPRPGGEASASIAPTTERRDQRVVGVGVHRVERERVGQPGERERDPERRARPRPRRSRRPRREEPKRGQEVEDDRRRVRRGNVAPVAVPREDQLERDVGEVVERRRRRRRGSPGPGRSVPA